MAWTAESFRNQTNYSPSELRVLAKIRKGNN